jgi:dGTPase
VKVSTATLKASIERPPGLAAGERWRSPLSLDPAFSRGRRHAEPPSSSRSNFQRDRDRIIHSTAFRRLKHKTQVFLEHEGDHFRTRLTHTLEVSQIARSIARALGLDEDLAETLALAHDLGHTPFGHAGERALDLALKKFGGFDHNAQSLKVVTVLERRYASFDGLNLTWETLEGLVKHNGPLTDRAGHRTDPVEGHSVPEYIRAFDREFPLELWTQSSAEAQAAAIADDIAYNAHDIDDGLRARILTLQELEEVPFLATILAEIRAFHPTLDSARVTHELQRRMITRLVEDVITKSWQSIRETGIATAKDVRALPRSIIGFSEELQVHVQSLRGFLFPRLYRHSRIMTEMTAAETCIKDLFVHYSDHSLALPKEWQEGSEQRNAKEQAIHIADFIAGMTDRYALETHRGFANTTHL